MNTWFLFFYIIIVLFTFITNEKPQKIVELSQENYSHVISHLYNFYYNAVIPDLFHLNIVPPNNILFTI